MVAKTIPVSAFDLVIFGATGDLARRKILPGLFKRYQAGQITNESRIVGSARSEMDTQGFRQVVRELLVDKDKSALNDPEKLEGFLKVLSYVRIDIKGQDGWEELKQELRPSVVQAFYLSVSPEFFGVISAKLNSYGIKDDDARIVVEKPFGHDLPSARALNEELLESFTEKQIYRIDHYLGKETVQNLMALRFSNALFEESWNARNIDHVQITVAETLGVDGRGQYYDGSGALRDMVQNHLMQLLCLTAMEPPSRFEPDAVRDEKLKVIRALKPIEGSDVVRGQYRGTKPGDNYLDHAGTHESRTESYIALKMNIANWRWAGTPFYLRTGKRLRDRVSEIAIMFRKPPHSIFSDQMQLGGNELVIRLQPNEGIELRMNIKDPGPGGMRLVEVPLDMSFAEVLGAIDDTPDAYERLIMDVVRGDQTLFMRGDELEAAWEWIDPIVESWSNTREKPYPYDAGGSGPEEAMMMMHQDGRRWRGIGS